jgi:starch synthase (maltosyl-transferring)
MNKTKQEYWPKKMGEGRQRVVIEHVVPEIDAGRFPVKRVVGDKVVVEADIFADSHDALSCSLLHRKVVDSEWIRTPMQPLANDRWRGSFRVTELGRYVYGLEAWIDRFETWRRDLNKKIEYEQDVSMDLLVEAQLIENAAARATGEDSHPCWETTADALN